LSRPQYSNRIAFYFTGVTVSGANAPPITGRALKLVDWMIVSYKSGNGVAEVLVFALVVHLVDEVLDERRIVARGRGPQFPIRLRVGMARIQRDSLRS
jgi:hypothetical protein